MRLTSPKSSRPGSSKTWPHPLALKAVADLLGTCTHSHVKGIQCHVQTYSKVEAPVSGHRLWDTKEVSETGVGHRTTLAVTRVVRCIWLHTGACPANNNIGNAKNTTVLLPFVLFLIIAITVYR